MKPVNKAAPVIDSKGLYDALTRSCCSQAMSVEKRLQIDYAIAKGTMVTQNIQTFWVNNLNVDSDALAKLICFATSVTTSNHAASQAARRRPSLPPSLLSDLQSNPSLVCIVRSAISRVIAYKDKLAGPRVLYI